MLPRPDERGAAPLDCWARCARTGERLAAVEDAGGLRRQRIGGPTASFQCNSALMNAQLDAAAGCELRQLIARGDEQ